MLTRGEVRKALDEGVKFGTLRAIVVIDYYRSSACGGTVKLAFKDRRSRWSHR